METFFTLILLVSLITNVITGFLITLKAFKKDGWWGLGCMISGIGAIIFMTEYWTENRALFITNISTFIVAIGAIFTLHTFSN